MTLELVLVPEDAPADAEGDLLLTSDDGAKPADDVSAGSTDNNDAGEPANPEGEKPEGEGEPAKGEEGDKPDADTKPKKPTGSERLKRRLERLEEENASLRAKTSAPAAPSADDTKAIEKAVLDEIGPAPKEEDFENFLDFDREMTVWKSLKAQATLQAKREAKANADREQTAIEKRTREMFDAHEDALDELEKVIPDARERIAKADGKAHANEHVARAILESDKSALLRLHLCTNPEKLAELNRMSERDALKAIGRLEARLHLPKPRTETKAPAPIRPVTGGGAAPSDPSRMSMAEYIAWRAKAGSR
jgi:hypothetical protein